MVQKIFERLNAINNFSKKIIKWGSLFSLLLCIGGIFIIEYNSAELNKISTFNLGSTMVYTAIVAFAQFVIGGLLIDFFGTLLSNRE